LVRLFIIAVISAGVRDAKDLKAWGVKLPLKEQTHRRPGHGSASVCVDI
jgi:hypothetical protein